MNDKLKEKILSQIAILKEKNIINANIIAVLKKINDPSCDYSILTEDEIVLLCDYLGYDAEKKYEMVKDFLVVSTSIHDQGFIIKSLIDESIKKIDNFISEINSIINTSNEKDISAEKLEIFIKQISYDLFDKLSFDDNLAIIEMLDLSFEEKLLVMKQVVIDNAPADIIVQVNEPEDEVLDIDDFYVDDSLEIENSFLEDNISEVLGDDLAGDIKDVVSFYENNKSANEQKNSWHIAIINDIEKNVKTKYDENIFMTMVKSFYESNSASIFSSNVEFKKFIITYIDYELNELNESLKGVKEAKKEGSLDLVESFVNDSKISASKLKLLYSYYKELTYGHEKKTLDEAFDSNVLFYMDSNDEIMFEESLKEIDNLKGEATNMLEDKFYGDKGEDKPLLGDSRNIRIYNKRNGSVAIIYTKLNGHYIVLKVCAKDDLSKEGSNPFYDSETLKVFCERLLSDSEFYNDILTKSNDLRKRLGGNSKK